MTETRLRAVSLAALVVLSVLSVAAFSGTAAAAGGVKVLGGTASPSEVSAGTSVSNQEVSVSLDNMSTDGNTDHHFLVVPNVLANSSNFGVNGVNFNNSYSTSKSPTLVEGYDNDGVVDTIHFHTQEGSSAVDHTTVTVDFSVTYPKKDTTLGFDYRVQDSKKGNTTVSPVATVTVNPIKYSDLQINDTTVTVGEDVNVSATVTNHGSTDNTYTANLMVNGGSKASESGTLPADTSTTVNFTVDFSSAGTYDVTIEDLASMTVDVASLGDFEITGGSADPSTVKPGTKVSSQRIHVVVQNVSMDGNTDTYWIEFPNELANASNFGVNGVSFNHTIDSTSSSPNVVLGFDGDGVKDTIKFAISPDGGGTVDLNITVDASTTYPNAEATYGIDVKVDDSDDPAVTMSDVATITAKESDGGGGGGGGGTDTTPPTISDFDVKHRDDGTVGLSFLASEDLSSVKVVVEHGGTSRTLTLDDFEQVGSTYFTTLATDPQGTYTATLKSATDAADNTGGSGQSDSVTVDADTSGTASASVTADPTTAGAGSASYTFSITLTKDSSVVGETLGSVSLSFPGSFTSGSGGVSSVSDDQNVVALKVVAADGTVKTTMGETDQVTVDTSGGVISIDASGVDSSKKVPLEAGDTIVVTVKPVSNPTDAGTYSVGVRVSTTTGDTDTASTSVRIRPENTPTPTPTVTPTATPTPTPTATPTASGGEGGTPGGGAEPGSPTDTESQSPGFGLAVGILALVSAAVVALRREE